MVNYISFIAIIDHDWVEFVVLVIIFDHILLSSWVLIFLVWLIWLTIFWNSYGYFNYFIIVFECCIDLSLLQIHLLSVVSYFRVFVLVDHLLFQLIILKGCCFNLWWYFRRGKIKTYYILIEMGETNVDRFRNENLCLRSALRDHMGWIRKRRRRSFGLAFTLRTSAIWTIHVHSL